MKPILFLFLLFVSTVAVAQNVYFNYDPTTDFAQYRTYEWVNFTPVSGFDEIADSEIKQAIDRELGQKGLQKVYGGADLLIVYHTSGEQGWRWKEWGTGYWPEHSMGETSLEIYDQADQRLVWIGSVAVRPNPNETPQEGYARLQKAMAKLLANFPQAVER